MSKYCRIFRNTDCVNHGRDITFHGDGWVCNYIPVPTNTDRIRAMSDEELAAYLVYHNPYSTEEFCLKWLRQPVKDGDNDG